MRLMNLFFVLAAFAAAVVAWDKLDHEIFDLVSAIETSEGKGTTFYSWLDISPSASTNEIAKAYRKKSVQLHPDKNPGIKNAHERFSRLGVVSKILRDQETRKRYDFFYKNGVPRWRGTGYYYSRFRPGLGTVFVFLVILTSSLQYLVQKLNYRRDLARIDWIIQQARSAAWGAKLIPTDGQRKVKVNLGGPSRLDEDGNTLAGRTVDLVVEGNAVFMVDSDGELVPLDSTTAAAPSLKRTWFLAIIGSVYHKLVKRGDTGTGDQALEEVEGEEGESGTDSTTSSGRGGKTVRSAATMAGGRRRKVARKR
ncbi:DnaJ-domain-containing protein [Cristinia sonorae]|uniref:DnaJ-domain-containing protein n=1 Tax=Cristinia sonorae TaxID=1940300 RepID=A0A8K0UWR5_9AGAR|nr:DnaJ-domain-containing protein [Cristinia sonorae]